MAPTRLNVYKLVANGGIGTGPDFADSASLGVPGFNEFYYLGRYPDARCRGAGRPIPHGA